MKTPFIVVDGLDGCGKGTQILLFDERARLEERGKFLFTREPGGVPLATEIRYLFKSDLGMQASAMTQSLLMWASRRAYLEGSVWPALEKGTPVLSDRGDDSTLAYQVYAKQAPELEAEFWRMRKLIFEDRAPTLYIIIDVPAAVARERSLADKTHMSQFDRMPIEWFENVKKGFAAFANALPDQVVIIDGNRPPKEVHEDFYRVVGNACGW
jgi:dTMP kinase